MFVIEHFFQILKATSDDEFVSSIANIAETAEQAGCLSFYKVADKQLFVDSICHHVIIGNCIMAIEQYVITITLIVN